MRSGRAVVLVLSAALLAGCVTPGYEGQVGNGISGDQMSTRREALKTVQYSTTPLPGYRKLKAVSVRRCHRNFTEKAPTEDALIEDLKVAAYAEGGELVTNVQSTTKNGLAANCWYVVEATADIWTKGG